MFCWLLKRELGCEFEQLRGFSCGDHEYGSKMAMATAVASTSFTSLKKNTVFGAGVQGLRAANQKVSVARPVAVPFAKLSTSSDGVAQQIAVGANTLAGNHILCTECECDCPPLDTQNDARDCGVVTLTLVSFMDQQSLS